MMLIFPWLRDADCAAKFEGKFFVAPLDKSCDWRSVFRIAVIDKERVNGVATVIDKETVVGNSRRCKELHRFDVP